MKMLIPFGVVLAVLTNCATAAMTVTIQDNGANLVINSSGTLNSGVCTSIVAGFTSNFNGIDPSVGNLAFGAVSSAQDQCAGTTITPTTGFGSGGSLAATTNTGVSYYFLPGIGFWGPSGWNSATAMTASMTIPGTSLAGMGITPGSYVYTFANGATTDTLTINAIAAAPSVPTPTLSEWGVMIMIALMALLGGRRYWHQRRI